jgi:hypothetical protein
MGGVSGVRFYFSVLQNVQTSCEDHTVFCLLGTGSKVAGGVKLTTHLHLAPRLRTTVVVPLHLYAFMAGTGATLPLHFHIFFLRFG